MKFRTGFVSNSSSANFIVRIKNDNYFNEKDPNFIIDKEDIPKLEEYGFKKSKQSNPFGNRDSLIKINNTDHISMKYSVTINYEEVASFLVKNNIPFRAACHYKQKYLSYKKDSDYVLEAINYGLIFNMYGDNYYDHFDIKDCKPFKKIPKNEFIENCDE